MSNQEDTPEEAPDDAATAFAKDQVIGPPDGQEADPPRSSETIEITPEEEGGVIPGPTPGSYVDTREGEGRHKK